MNCDYWPKKTADCENEPVVEIRTSYGDGGSTEIKLCQDCLDRRSTEVCERRVMELSTVVIDADREGFPHRREILSRAEDYVVRNHYSLVVREWRDRDFPGCLLRSYEDKRTRSLDQAVTLTYGELDNDRLIYNAIREDVIKRRSDDV